MKNTGKTIKSGGKHGQEARKDRKSTTGMNGYRKKEVTAASSPGPVIATSLRLNLIRIFFNITVTFEWRGHHCCFVAIVLHSTDSTGRGGAGTVRRPSPFLDGVGTIPIPLSLMASVSAH
ncbi:hypothetical protein HanRHA438_Chr02g0056181 [Helianthus annuus]|nr:hypothetical protein HanRHA438_Chr02g0056181 [Helianthus annuus]